MSTLFHQVAPTAREILLDRGRLAEMYRTRTQGDLAAELGTTVETLRAALRHWQIPIHPRGWVPRRGADTTPGCITREDLQSLVWRLYWQADRCPPDCPGREECIEPGGECTLGRLLDGAA